MISYRENQNSDTDEDSGDSDNESAVWKRAKRKESSSLQNVEMEAESASKVTQNNKRKRNTIWSDILQDQLISEDLNDCLLKNKPVDYGSRGHESYDYTLKYTMSEVKDDIDCPMSNDENSCKSEENSVSSMKNHTFKSKKFVKLDSTEHSAATKIIKTLSEKKAYLICRVVRELGIEKAMNLLSMTEQIEDSGGMMTVDNTRRRTPGGVYFHLLKNDKDVAQETLDRIFEHEMNGFEYKNYIAELKKNKLFKKKKSRNTRSKRRKTSKASKSGNKDKPSKAGNEDEPSKDDNVDDRNMCDEAMSNMEFSEENCATSVPVVKRIDSDLEDGEIESDVPLD